MSTRHKTRRRLLRALGPAAAGLALGGCTSLLGGGGSPDIFQLTPKSTFPPDLPRLDARMLVEPVSTATGLGTQRIALTRGFGLIEYYADATWIDVLPAMVRTLLIESFDNSGTIDAVASSVSGGRADYALAVHLREFQAQYLNDTEAPDVLVRLDARLLTLPRREVLDVQSFPADFQAETPQLGRIVEGFDEAFGTAVRELVVWSIDRIAEREGVVRT